MNVIGGLLWKFITLLICVHKVFDKLSGVLRTPKGRQSAWCKLALLSKQRIVGYPVLLSLFTVYSGYCLLEISCILNFLYKVTSLKKKELKEIVHHGKQREDGDPSFFQLSFRHCSAQCQHSYLLTEVTDSSDPLYLGFYFRCFLFPASIVLMSQAILNCY